MGLGASGAELLARVRDQNPGQGATGAAQGEGAPSVGGGDSRADEEGRHSGDPSRVRAREDRSANPSVSAGNRPDHYQWEGRQQSDGQQTTEVPAPLVAEHAAGGSAVGLSGRLIRGVLSGAGQGHTDADTVGQRPHVHVQRVTHGAPDEPRSTTAGDIGGGTPDRRGVRDHGGGVSGRFPLSPAGEGRGDEEEDSPAHGQLGATDIDSEVAVGIDGDVSRLRDRPTGKQDAAGQAAEDQGGGPTMAPLATSGRTEESAGILCVAEYPRSTVEYVGQSAGGLQQGGSDTSPPGAAGTATAAQELSDENGSSDGGQLVLRNRRVPRREELHVEVPAGGEGADVCEGRVRPESRRNHRSPARGRGMAQEEAGSALTGTDGFSDRDRRLEAGLQGRGGTEYQQENMEVPERANPHAMDPSHASGHGDGGQGQQAQGGADVGSGHRLPLAREEVQHTTVADGAICIQSEPHAQYVLFRGEYIRREQLIGRFRSYVEFAEYWKSAISGEILSAHRTALEENNGTSLAHSSAMEQFRRVAIDGNHYLQLPRSVQYSHFQIRNGVPDVTQSLLFQITERIAPQVARDAVEWKYRRAGTREKHMNALHVHAGMAICMGDSIIPRTMAAYIRRVQSLRKIYRPGTIYAYHLGFTSWLRSIGKLPAFMSTPINEDYMSGFQTVGRGAKYHVVIHPYDLFDEICAHSDPEDEMDSFLMQCVAVLAVFGRRPQDLACMLPPTVIEGQITLTFVGMKSNRATTDKVQITLREDFLGHTDSQLLQLALGEHFQKRQKHLVPPGWETMPERQWFTAQLKPFMLRSPRLKQLGIHPDIFRPAVASWAGLHSMDETLTQYILHWAEKSTFETYYKKICASLEYVLKHGTELILDLQYEELPGEEPAYPPDPLALS